MPQREGLLASITPAQLQYESRVALYGLLQLYLPTYPYHTTVAEHSGLLRGIRHLKRFQCRFVERASRSHLRTYRQALLQ